LPIGYFKQQASVVAQQPEPGTQQSALVSALASKQHSRGGLQQGAPPLQQSAVLAVEVGGARKYPPVPAANTATAPTIILVNMIQLQSV
jgi:hypothetical protein